MRFFFSLSAFPITSGVNRLNRQAPDTAEPHAGPPERHGKAKKPQDLTGSPAATMPVEDNSK